MAMHVARTPSTHVDKAGNARRYEAVLVRRSYRDGKKVRHQTLANLSKRLPTLSTWSRPASRARRW